MAGTWTDPWAWTPELALSVTRLNALLGDTGNLQWLKDRSERMLAAVGELTISSGAITVTPDDGYGAYAVSAESGTADDLTTISGGVDGDMVLLYPTSGHVITLKAGCTNLATDVTIPDNGILLHYRVIPDGMTPPAYKWYPVEDVAQVDVLQRKAGQWQGPWFAGATSAFTAVANYLYYVPFFLKRTCTITDMEVTCSTAVALAKARLGIYSDSGVLVPNALLLDAGEVDVSTTGSKPISSLSTVLQAGHYWLALLNKAASVDYVGCYTISNLGIGVTGAANGIVTRFTEARTYSSGFPATATGAVGTGVTPLVKVKF